MLLEKFVLGRIMKCLTANSGWTKCSWGRGLFFNYEGRARCGFVFALFFLGSSLTTSIQAYENSSATFVEKCEMDCSAQRDVLACGKYRVVRWLHDVVREKEFNYGPFRLIRIPSAPQVTVLPKFPRSRVFRSSAMETLSFARDAVEDLITKRAIVYTIDNSVGARKYNSKIMIVDEDELEDLQRKKYTDGNGWPPGAYPSHIKGDKNDGNGVDDGQSYGDWRIFKKKKSLILPLLILLNLLKLKLLLIPIFLGVHFIKKLLVLGSLIVPSILAHLKVCKVPPQPQQTYPHHTWATAAEAPVDYPTGYGHEDPSSWAHRNDLQGHIIYANYPANRYPYGVGG